MSTMFYHVSESAERHWQDGGQGQIVIVEQLRDRDDGRNWVFAGLFFLLLILGASLLALGGIGLILWVVIDTVAHFFT